MNGDKKEFVMPAKSILQTEEKSTSILVESGGEFVLPDYMPKVQKVLRLEARALPPSRYIGGNSAEMTGSVLHTLVYLGEDGEVSATVLPSKYEFSIPLPASDAAPMVTAAVDVDTVTHRLSAPRKINIRTRLRALPSVFVSEDIVIPAADSQTLHKLCCELDSVSTKLLRSEDISLSDSIETGGGEDAKLLWCGSCAAVSDVRITDSGADVRGEVLVKVLVDENGTPKMYTKKIPFGEFVDGDVAKGASAIAVAKVISTEAAREKSGEVLVDVVFVIEAKVDTPCKLSAVKDVFSEVGEGKVEYRKVPVVKHVLSRSGIYNAGGSVPKSAAGTDGIASVIDTAGEAVLDDITVRDGKITASGRCNLNSVFHTEDGGVSSADYSVPFAITLNAETPSGTETAGSASLMAARVRTDGANLVCDMDIALSVRACVRGEENIIANTDFASPKLYEKSKHPLCIIYPGGESIWALSKKYHVSPDTLVKVNSLDIDKKDYADASALASARVLMLELK